MNMPLEKTRLEKTGLGKTRSEKDSVIDEAFYHFINDEVLSHGSLDQQAFWHNLDKLIADFAPINRALLNTRSEMQAQIDNWHQARQGQAFDAQAYQAFLREIGYLLDEGDDFEIGSDKVDSEIAQVAGPQLVVPVNNARFAINAANARWGSLYDALYGSDVIPQAKGLQAGKNHNQARGNHVIAYARQFLDDTFPLCNGSHADVINYMVYYQHLLAMFPDGSTSGLEQPGFGLLQGARHQSCWADGGAGHLAYFESAYCQLVTA